MQTGFIRAGAAIGMVALLSGFYAPQDDEFTRFWTATQSEFEKVQQQQKDEFEAFVVKWQEAAAAYQQEIARHWRQPVMPSKHVWVTYTDDMQSRVIVDYQQETVRVEFKNHELSQQEALRLAQQQAQELGSLSVEQAIQEDPVHQAVGLEVAGSSLQEMTVISENDKQAIEQQHPQIQQTGDAVRVQFQLPATSISQRAEQYVDLAERYAKEYQLPTALVLAVIHSESSFNPLARSHIPAFGLMQIVPQSAGRDVTEFLTGKQYVLTAEELYVPETNVRSGSVYLHLLSQRYFKSVHNPQARLYMSIAAYNTGPGNVSRALSGTTSLSRASQVANTMTAVDMYHYLLENLPHQETKDYLVRVAQRQQAYEEFLLERNKA